MGNPCVHFEYKDGAVKMTFNGSILGSIKVSCAFINSIYTTWQNEPEVQEIYKHLVQTILAQSSGSVWKTPKNAAFTSIKKEKE